MKPEKDAGHGPGGCTNPHLPPPWSSVHPTPWSGTSTPSAVGAQTNPLSLRGGGHCLRGCRLRWGGGIQELSIITTAGSCSSIWATAIQPTFFCGQLMAAHWSGLGKVMVAALSASLCLHSKSHPSKPWYKSPERMAMLAKSKSSMCASKRVMLVMPTI